MKKTFHLLILALLLSLSSCVYSLFPIYTKDTLVYLKELEGTWKNEKGEIISITGVQPNVSVSVDVDPGDDEFIIENGDTIRDKGKIEAYWQKEFQKEVEPELLAFVNKTYHLQMIDKQDTLGFKTQLAKIGDDYYMDLFPTEDYDDEFMAKNLFPVHTFMKVNVSDDRLTLTKFDLGKLVDLFESNRIRLRHEKVHNSIVITAQPKEIQKFLLSYSKDESVFETPENFTRTTAP